MRKSSELKRSCLCQSLTTKKTMDDNTAQPRGGSHAHTCVWYQGLAAEAVRSTALPTGHCSLPRSILLPYECLCCPGLTSTLPLVLMTRGYWLSYFIPTLHFAFKFSHCPLWIGAWSPWWVCSPLQSPWSVVTDSVCKWVPGLSSYVHKGKLFQNLFYNV